MLLNAVIALLCFCFVKMFKEILIFSSAFMGFLHYTDLQHSKLVIFFMSVSTK